MLPFRVHIIESPSPDDFLAERYEGRLLRAALTQAQLPVQLHTVVDSSHFYAALVAVMTATLIDTQEKIVPCLHLSMHGNETGIKLTNGDRLAWAELAKTLSLLNEVLDDNLFVVMSTCHGYAAVEMARGEGHPPFYALVGPTEKVSWNDTVAAFVAYYHHLIARDGSVMTGVEVINQVLRKELFKCKRASDARKEWKREKHLGDLKKIAEMLEAMGAKK